MTNPRQTLPTPSHPRRSKLPNPPPPPKGPSVTSRNLVHLLLAGNPLYLVSAAMMLYGLHQVATDSSLLQQELSKLWFKVSSIEIYELMIVGVAIVLARRRVWYDSNLLITLENLFMFVPFLLISQATLFDNGIEAGPTRFVIDDINMWMVCLTVCVLATIRFAALRKISMLRMPTSLILFGMALIIANTAAPLWFRYVISGNDSDAWARLSPVIWVAGLPLLVVIVNFLPGLQGPADRLLSRRNWPRVLPLVWITATAVHLRVIDYLDDIPFEIQAAAPLAWAMLWTAFFRPEDFTPVPLEALKRRLVVAPFLASFLAASLEPAMFMSLMTGNVIIYALLSRQGRHSSIVKQMAVASFFMVAAAMPDRLGLLLVPDFSREKVVILALMSLLTYLFSLRRDAFGTLFSAGLFGGIISYHFDYLDAPGPYAMQAAILFGIIHSMYWTSGLQHDRALRVAFNLALPVHAFFWGRFMDIGHADINVSANTALAGLLTLACCSLYFRLAQAWPQRIYLITGVATLVVVPVNGAITLLKVAPSGHLTVLGSFIVFAAATFIALKKERWTSGEVRLGDDLPGGGSVQVK